MLNAVATRIGQVGHALTARWQAVDITRLETLTPPERALFAQMSPSDRLHALRVADRLYRGGERHPALLKAGLLHDIGKARQGIHLPHRIARVLLSRLAPATLERLATEPTGWRRPLYALVNHARLGAIQLEQHGSDPVTVALVRFHDAPDWPSELAAYKPLWRALRAADDAE